MAYHGLMFVCRSTTIARHTSEFKVLLTLLSSNTSESKTYSTCRLLVDLDTTRPDSQVTDLKNVANTLAQNCKRRENRKKSMQRHSMHAGHADAASGLSSTIAPSGNCAKSAHMIG